MSCCKKLKSVDPPVSLPAAGFVQELGPPLPQALELGLDLVPVLGVGRGGDPLALRLDHLDGGPPVVQQPLQQLGGGRSGRGGLSHTL